MKIFGIDFTSAPTARKPIVVACCEANTELNLLEFRSILSLNVFSTFLETEGPWVGGFDFPFSQPRKFIENIGFSTEWEQMMAEFARLSKAELEALLFEYRSQRPGGYKHHLRHTDTVSKSISPMMIHGVPVGKMFHTGAVALWKSSACAVPMQSDTTVTKTALEVYPALVARKYSAGASYKTDTASKNTNARILAREKIVDGMINPSDQDYGFPVIISNRMAQKMIDDFRGDFLDAMAAAVLAAWAWTKRDHQFGIPRDVDPLEGWIIDPDHYKAENHP